MLEKLITVECGSKFDHKSITYMVTNWTETENQLVLCVDMNAGCIIRFPYDFEVEVC